MLTLIERKFTLANGTTSWSYQIQGTCPYTGEPVRKGTRTRSRKIAEDKLRILLEQRRDRALNGDESIANFADAVAEYLAKGGEDRYIAPLLDAFGTTRLTALKDTDITEFCGAHYPGAKASTLVRQVYGPIQWIWQAAVNARLAKPRTFARPTVKRSPAKYANTDEWTKKVLLACTNDQQRAALMFMSYSGARASEVVAVTEQDHDVANATIRLQRTKGGYQRVVALPPFVNAALAKIHRGKSQASLFGYASRYSLVRILKRTCKRAGVEYLSPHKAGRHTFAARLLRNGASLKDLQEAGGWNDIGIVARTYAHLEASAVAARVRNVADPMQLGDCTMPDTMSNLPSSPTLIIEAQPIEKKSESE